MRGLPYSRVPGAGCLQKVDNINDDQENHSESSSGCGQALRLRGWEEAVRTGHCSFGDDLHYLMCSTVLKALSFFLVSQLILSTTCKLKTIVIPILRMRKEHEALRDK